MIDSDVSCDYDSDSDRTDVSAVAWSMLCLLNSSSQKNQQRQKSTYRTMFHISEVMMYRNHRYIVCITVTLHVSI